MHINIEHDELKPLRICVIGAGAAGLAAVKIIKDSPEFRSGSWTVDAYEQRDDFGGIWSVFEKLFIRGSE